MTASTGTLADPYRARTNPAKPTSLGQKPGSLPQRDLREACLTATHQLSEPVTAIANYLASALRLAEIEEAGATMRLRHTEIFYKAFGQVARASEVIKRFRQLLNEDTGNAVDTSAVQERARISVGPVTGYAFSTNSPEAIPL